MSTPLVSAITIFRDAERFLPDAVASILAQTWPTWELLLVDDGSRDGGTAWARETARAHPERIRYLAHPGHENRGMSATRNLGVREARGTLVAFLDADDVWLPDTLARQVVALTEHPRAGMVCGATEYWWGWTGEAADRARDAVRPMGVGTDTVIEPPALLLRFLRDETPPPGTCSALLRRAVYAAVHGFEERFAGMYEDQAFFAKVALTTPVLVTEACVARYRQHPDSCYSRARAAGTAGAAELAYLRWLARHVAAHHRAGAGPDWTALRKMLAPHRHPRLHRLAERLGAVRDRFAARTL